MSREPAHAQTLSQIKLDEAGKFRLGFELDPKVRHIQGRVHHVNIEAKAPSKK